MAITDTSAQGALFQAGVAGEADGVTIVYDATEPHGFADETRCAVRLDNPATNTWVRSDEAEAVDGKLLLVTPDGKVTVAVNGVHTMYAGNGDNCNTGKIIGADDASSDPGRVREVATGTAAEVALGRHQVVEGGTNNAAVLIQLGA